MGKRNPIVSFLCGVFGRKKTPSPNQGDENGNADKQAERSESSSSSCSGRNEAKEAGNPDDRTTTTTTSDSGEQQPPLPPPPGGFHTRTVSCRHQQQQQHERSQSFTARLASSLSLKLPGHVHSAVGKQISRLEEKAVGIREKSKMKHEESLWKKTIILGERNRVPSEEEDAAIFDEKGNKVSPYHQRSQSMALSFSRPNNSNNKADDDKDDNLQLDHKDAIDTTSTSSTNVNNNNKNSTSSSHQQDYVL